MAALGGSDTPTAVNEMTYLAETLELKQYCLGYGKKNDAHRSKSITLEPSGTYSSVLNNGLDRHIWLVEISNAPQIYSFVLSSEFDCMPFFYCSSKTNKT